MFLFAKDLKPVGDARIASINKATGKRYYTSDKAIEKARTTLEAAPLVAMMLAEHPDPRVPLALAQSRLIDWDKCRGRVLRLALRNRALLDAKSAGHVWTPLLDATCVERRDQGRINGRFRAYARDSQILELGYSHALWRARRTIPRPQNDPFLEGPYAQYIAWDLAEDLQPHLRYVDAGMLARFEDEYQNITFWRQVCNVMPEKVRWPGPNRRTVGVGYVRAAMEFGNVPEGNILSGLKVLLADASRRGERRLLVIGAIDAYVHNRATTDNIIKAWPLVEQLCPVVVTFREYCEQCCSRWFSTDIGQTRRLVEFITNGIQDSSRAYSAILKGIIAYGAIDTATAKIILAASASPVVREALALGPARTNSEIARFLGRSVNPIVMERISKGNADCVLAVFDNMVKVAPDSAKAAAAKTQGVIEGLDANQIAPLLANGNPKLNGAIIGALKTAGRAR